MRHFGFQKLNSLLFSLVSVSALALGGSRPQPSPDPSPSPNPAPAPTPVPSPSVIPPPRWQGKHADAPRWTQHSTEEIPRLGAGLLTAVPADIDQFCPSYPRLSREKQIAFWIYLISSMVQFESNFKPETAYTENFRDQNGNFVVSRGLLQISIESSNGYSCGFRTESELHDPLKNLSCGVRILNRWISRDGRIAGKVGSTWQGGARYWSVLRTAERVASIKSFTTGYCRGL